MIDALLIIFANYDKYLLQAVIRKQQTALNQRSTVQTYYENATPPPEAWAYQFTVEVIIVG